ncbi:bifunctional lysine ketoglutarate reductase /saccharopine dehydrogenase family protein [Balneolaceae bacterium ANBcel3]|nr:bifunctional lysine ketoglutarate reductase /saccharopine dehydrogenase family protein [Balneolaceae bacterium ANBcel3]
MNKVAIRIEDKYDQERRIPLVPEDIGYLVKKNNIPIIIQSSKKRVFSDEEFLHEGAEVSEDISDADVVLGVKEMAPGSFSKDKVYMYFSHVIKGQSYNMPMLRDLMRSGATLIDYECIVSDEGRRLVYFGKHAGYAGAINTLWALGQRLKRLGNRTPFENIRQAVTYSSLNEAKTAVAEAGLQIKENGTGLSERPIILGVTGFGNVSKGVLEILEELPLEMIDPLELLTLDKNKLDSDKVYLVHIRVAHYLIHKEEKPFSYDHYFAHPKEYRTRFEDFLPLIDVLFNGIYWDHRYPRLVTQSWLRKRAVEGVQVPLVIGDITCDPLGSIECTLSETSIDDPVYMYDPVTGAWESGFEGNGVAVMAVDILPSEIPREASAFFSGLLREWLPSLAQADFQVAFEQLKLPDELKRAVIVHRGKLTPKYAYLKESL